MGPPPPSRPRVLCLALTLAAVSVGAFLSVPNALADSVGSWTSPPTGLPPGRSAFGAIRDVPGDQLVLFGGTDGTNSWNDVWALPLDDDGVWARLAPTGTPPIPRTGCVAVYDGTRRRLLVFGGVGLNDLWTLSLDSLVWTPLIAMGTPPAARAYCAAIYDSLRNRVLVVDGLVGATYQNEVWALSLGETPTWTLLATAGGSAPSARGRTAAAYDALRDRLLLFGGASATYPSGLNDLWALSIGEAIPAWGRLGPYAAPSNRYDHTLAYDAARDRLVLCGGRGVGYYSDVQVLPLPLNQFTWSQLPAGSGPDGRAGHGMVLDSVRDRLVITHGAAAVSYDDTWRLVLASGGAWQKVAGSPSLVCLDAAMVYDSARDQLVLFGGSTACCFSHAVYTRPLGDLTTWWTLLDVQGTPPLGRAYAGAIYDPVRDRMILYGGTMGRSLGDVWQLSLSGTPTWTQLAPAGPSPTPRQGHGVAYDPVRDRLLVYGGQYGPYACYPNQECVLSLGDVWQMTLDDVPTWTQLLPQGTKPTSRYHALAAYDPVADAFVIVGGNASPGGLVNDAWSLSLDGTPAWTQLQPSGSLPPLRDRATGVYDRVRGRLVVFGGLNESEFNDVWALTLGPLPSWAQLFPSGPLPFARSDHAAVYDPVRDRMVVYGGKKYGIGELWDTWSLSWNEPVTAVGPPISSAGRLTASAFAPNPFRARTGLTYTLQGKCSSVRARVFDIRGRHIAWLANAPCQSGIHRVSWDGRDDEARKVAPGLYVLRLEADAVTVVRSVLLTR